MTEAPTRQHRLTEMLAPMFADAFSRCAPGETLEWEIFGMAYPDPNRGNMPVTTLILYVQAPGSLLNSTIGNTTMLPPFGLTQEHIDDTCRAVVGQISEQRSVMLQQMQAEAASGNGNPLHDQAVEALREKMGPPPGLIVPD